MFQIRKVKELVEKEVISDRYTNKRIEELIRKDAESQGIKVSKIDFHFAPNMKSCYFNVQGKPATAEKKLELMNQVNDSNHQFPVSGAKLTDAIENYENEKLESSKPDKKRGRKGGKKK
jgi:hypothetical protein